MKSSPQCCPSTRVPALIPTTEYEEHGNICHLDGLRVYITGTPVHKKAIIVLADVFGMDSGRHKGISDQFAAEEYYVIMPDIFHDDKLLFADLETPRLGQFLRKWAPSTFAPDMDKVYAHLEDKGIEKTGMVGFCWGSWAIFHESGRGGKFHAGACFHPSLVIEQLAFYKPVVDLAHNCQNPMLLGACSDDPKIVKPGGAVATVLSQKSFGNDCEYHVFVEQKHGFVSQGDLSDSTISRDVELAMKLATEFFSRQLELEPQKSESRKKRQSKPQRKQKKKKKKVSTGICEAIEQKQQNPTIVLLTGAAGNIGYQLIFAITRGDMLGENHPIELRLLEITPCMNALKGIVMEINDCAFPLVTKIIATDDYETAFTGIDLALLVGSFPRGPGMERGDLLKANANIFKEQGEALDKYAKKSVKVLVVGNPANTNALIASQNAPSLSKTAFTALTRLDQNRAKFQLAKKLGKPVSTIKKVAIWGNHSSTQYPDSNHTVVVDAEGNESTPYLDAKWVEQEFIPNIQRRGRAIIATRKKSSAASAAEAIIGHVKDWVFGTPEGDWSSMGILSDGKTYNIPEGLIFSFPCICKDGAIVPVRELSISEQSKARIMTTLTELQHEKSIIQSLKFFPTMSMIE